MSAVRYNYLEDVLICKAFIRVSNKHPTLNPAGGVFREKMHAVFRRRQGKLHKRLYPKSSRNEKPLTGNFRDARSLYRRWKSCLAPRLGWYMVTRWMSKGDDAECAMRFEMRFNGESLDRYKACLKIVQHEYMFIRFMNTKLSFKFPNPLDESTRTSPVGMIITVTGHGNQLPDMRQTSEEATYGEHYKGSNTRHNTTKHSTPDDCLSQDTSLSGNTYEYLWCSFGESDNIPEDPENAAQKNCAGKENIHSMAPTIVTGNETEVSPAQKAVTSIRDGEPATFEDDIDGPFTHEDGAVATDTATTAATEKASKSIVSPAIDQDDSTSGDFPRSKTGGTNSIISPACYNREILANLATTKTTTENQAFHPVGLVKKTLEIIGEVLSKWITNKRDEFLFQSEYVSTPLKRELATARAELLIAEMRSKRRKLLDEFY